MLFFFKFQNFQLSSIINDSSQFSIKPNSMLQVITNMKNKNTQENEKSYTPISKQNNRTKKKTSSRMSSLKASRHVRVPNA